MNLILASKDAVALDSIATMVMGERPLSVHTTKNAMQRGLGVAKLEEIEIVGENAVTNFVLNMQYIWDT